MSLDTSTKKSFSGLSKVWPYIAHYKCRVIISMLLVVLGQLLVVANPYIIKELVDTLSEGEKADIAFNTLFVLVGLFFLFRWGSDIINGLREYIFAKVSVGIKQKASADIFQHLISLPVAFHSNQASGAVARKITRGTSALSTLSFFITASIFPTLIEIFLVVVVFLYLFPFIFTAVFLGFVVVYVAYTLMLTNRRQKILLEMNQRDDQSSQQYIDALMNYETVKYFTNESLEINRYQKALDSWRDKALPAAYRGADLNIGQGFILTIGLTALLGLGAWEYLHGDFTLGDFVLITTYISRIAMPLSFLGTIYRTLMESLANLDAMFQLLDESPRSKRPTGQQTLTLKEGQIEFQNLGFSYNQDRVILKQVDISVPAKTSLALVGASGSGKSTITKLLLRLYDLDEGTILIDGHNIETVTKQSLRKTIGVVAQDTILFNASILENIRYGNPQATTKQVEEAAKLANIHERIIEFTQGYETPVGERGVKLSGGEKQRIAIARMLLKNPPVMVFDEATASLDSHSEQVIQESIRGLSKTARTTIVVAHRLSTIADFDQIVVMDKGQVVESGDHHALLEQKGAYYRLWQAQKKTD